MRYIQYSCESQEGMVKLLTYSKTSEGPRVLMFEQWKDYGPDEDRVKPPSRKWTYYSAILGQSTETLVLADVKLLEAGDDNVKFIAWVTKSSGFSLLPGRAYIRR